MYIITGDILRPEPNSNLCHQRHNIDWLDNKCSNLVSPSMLIGPDKPLTFEEWYKTDKPTKEICKHLEIINSYNFDYNQICVIGFELPNNFIDQLEENYISYLDISLHPIRFCKQKIYGLKSNCQLPKTLTEEFFFNEAKKYQGIELNKKYNLVVGQTRIDRSLLNNGKMLNLLDFTDQLINLRPILYKPHPLDKEYQTWEMNKLGATITHENIYNLLASDQIEHVYGISSSVLYEAKYFNKASTFFCERKEHSNFVPILEDTLFTKEFFMEF